MPRGRSLTELEGTVLGVVWSRQPCTPYQVRREFAGSPSPYWSGSAGAIYPLMARLEDAGLVRSRAHATGSRKSRLYGVTPAGRRALVGWIDSSAPEIIAGVPPDPLRARVAFMTALPAARRRMFLERSAARMAALLARAERDLAEGQFPGPYFKLMARGAIAMQKTRLKWVRGALASVRREDGVKSGSRGRRSNRE